MTSSDLRHYRLHDGDLLVCEGGEVGRAAIGRNYIDEGYYQRALHRLRPKRDYKPELMVSVRYLLASEGILGDFVTQTRIAHLPKEKFEKVAIPLPMSSLEQKAIVEVLSDADALIESLQELLTGGIRLV